MKNIKQDIYELIPAIVGMVALISMRLTYGAINFQTTPGRVSFLLLLVGGTSFICLILGKGKQRKVAFWRLLISGLILTIIGSWFFYKSFRF